MKTEKITFEDGSWWEFRAGLSVGMSRAVEEATKPFLKLKDPAAPVPSPGDILTGKAPAPETEIDPEKFRAEPVDDALLLAATKAWSYGPLDMETLKNEVPQPHYVKVSGRLQELLAPFLAGTGTG